MKDFLFHIPTKIVFGVGKINELHNYLDEKFNSILLVTDEIVAKESGAIEKIQRALQDRQVYIFDQVEENPSVQLVDKGKQSVFDNDVNLVIGIGGGSSMDAAKGIAVLATNDGSMADFLNGELLKNDPLPVVCVPTSSGTGSEVTPYAVFTDLENKSKGGYCHEKIFPILSVVDPELTYSMPLNVILNTGIDVLTHAIEAYLSTESFILNDNLALHAISMVVSNLEKAKNKDEESMNLMAYASMIAGITITHAGTILLHIMGYPLTVFHRVPHGKANGILLPEFLRFMKEKSKVQEKINCLEEIFESKGGVEKFVNNLGISTNLSDYGIKETEFEKFVEKVIIKDDIRITPAPVSASDILNIYKNAF